MLGAVALSFTNYSGGPNYRFIGLKNYIVAFTNPDFLSYLYVTFKFMSITVMFQIGLGLAFALVLAKHFKGCRAFRGILYLPNILSSVAVGLAFMLNQFLGSLGLPTSKWLASSKSSLSVIITIAIWQNFGYYMVLFIGGLQNISSTLYEAAEMDGAGRIRQFLNVTIPGLSPFLFFGLTIAIIRGFQVFDYVYIMTGGQLGGGPAGSTNVLAFDIYLNAFTFFRFGYASAESVVLMIIILSVTYMQSRGQRKWVSYDVV